jgi:hypothetical protein
MIAFKFLRTGRIGPFSEFRWPEPGVWVQAAAVPEQCRQGVHACRASDLPWWLADELWEVELRGEIHAGRHKVMAADGRLRARVAAWSQESSQEFAEACAGRATEHAAQALQRAGHRAEAARLIGSVGLDDALAMARRLAIDVPVARTSLRMAGDCAVRALGGAASTSAYIAAHAAHRLDGPQGYAVERWWQSEWLVRRLELEPV